MTSFIDPNGNTDLLSGNELLLILFPNTGPQALSYPCDKECAFASWLVEFGALPVSLVQRADHWPNKKKYTMILALFGPVLCPKKISI